MGKISRIALALVLAVASAILSQVDAWSKDYPISITLPATTHPVADERQLASAIRSGNLITSLPANLTPTPWHANDRSIIYAAGCMENRDITVRSKCVFGDISAVREMWLIGDSHAAQWFYAAQLFALRHHYKLVVHAKSNCELTHPIAKHIAWPACTGLNAYWRQHIKRDRPRIVLVGLYQGWTKSIVPEVQSALKLLAKWSKRVVLIGDTPKRKVDTRQCLKAYPTAVQNCSTQIGDGIDFATASQLSQGAKRNNYKYLDTHTWLCQQSRCPVIAENLILYRDVTHITGVAATWLAPVFDDNLSKLIMN